MRSSGRICRRDSCIDEASLGQQSASDMIKNGNPARYNVIYVDLIALLVVFPLGGTVKPFRSRNI
jgi:hypothetical protein